MISLVKPDLCLKEKFIDMIKDYNYHKEDTFNSDYFNENFDFETYIKDFDECLIESAYQKDMFLQQNGGL
jgi:predicted acetyltransferase